MSKIRNLFTPKDMTEGTPWKRLLDLQSLIAGQCCSTVV